MDLRDEFEHSGNWLFRWRSYVPVMLLAVLLLALTGFHYPEGSHKLDTLWDALCLLVAMFGLGIRFYTVGHAAARTSGRNTKHQVADVLNTTGMYSIVRHPLYLGNFLMWLGLSLFPRVWWCPVVVVLCFALFYERIMFAEEQFLRQRFGQQFTDWANKTPAFFPRFSLWKAPAVPFSLRRALKGEYSGFFGLIVIFTLLEVLGTVVAERRFEFDVEWVILFCVGLVVYIVLRHMKHRKLLEQ